MKKILSLYLVVIFSLTMCASLVTASAEEQTDETLKNAEMVISLVSDGIDFDVSTVDSVTRSEFITSAIDLMKIPHSETAESVFEDVDSTETLSGYLEAAISKGAVSKGNLFYPYQDITYIQAIKMALVLTGWQIPAEASGGFPEGYKKIAEEKDFTEGLTNINYNAPITKRDAKVLLANMLTCNIMSIKTYDSNDPVIAEKDGVNTLSEVYDIYEFKGIVSANENTGIYSPDEFVKDGCIQIDGESYILSDQSEDYLGYNVKGWYHSDEDDERTVLYMEPQKTKTIKVMGYEIDDVKDNTIYYGTEYNKKLKLEDVYSVIYNGKALTASDFAEYIKTKDGSIECIDNDNDGKYDIVKVSDVKYIVVSNINARDKIIYDLNNIENNIKLSNDCKYTVWDTYYYGRVQVDFESIENQMVLAIQKSQDEKLVSIDICMKEVKGKITSIENNNKYIYIDGEKYRTSEYAKKYLKVNLAAQYYFNLGLNGEIVSVSLDTTGNHNYGFIIKGFNDVNGIQDHNWTFKLYDQGAKISTYEVAERVKIDGVSLKGEPKIEKLREITEQTDDKKKLIKFVTNKKGEITIIDTPQVPANIDDYYKIVDGDEDNNMVLYSEHTDALYKRSVGAFDKKVRLGEESLVFKVPSEDMRSSADNFSIEKVGYFGNDIRYSIVSYDVDKRTGIMKAGLMISNEGQRVSSFSRNICLVVDKYTMEADGEIAIGIKMWSFEKSGFEEYYVIDDKSQTATIANELEVGDLIRCNTFGDRITGIAHDYDFSKKEWLVDSGSKNTYYADGYVYSYNDEGTSGSLLWVDKSVNLDSLENCALNTIGMAKTPTVIFIDYSEDKNGNIEKTRVYTAPSSEVRTYLNSGSDADYVVLKFMNNEAEAAFVYKKVG